ncbi:hypothetical protein G3570_02410 [Balneolaceae bacterium YR4-1]|uniref:Uncharacterized protein n=1 Tax=Halalkalibaculum roseum TaxID=2709311 RepID=A0A6M1SKA0_9BACT|nr:hypothetical protein [Halalkalibaculum roseum]NGP75469.1 hypothetical protein [Halalkalibaculum roseum]
MNEVQTGPAVHSTGDFQSNFISDTTLTNRDSIDVLSISNGSMTEEILAITNCDKNAEENTIKIQIRSTIPTIAELKEGSTGGRIFMGLAGWPKKAQFRFLTFHLKDSTIEKAQLFYKSLEKAYDNSDFKYSNISKYQLRISKFDYSIASDVYGRYNIQLPEPFGYFDSDTLLSGTFVCNNWRIDSLEEIKNWDLEAFFRNNRGSIR